jgi:hypothetical protein
MKINEKVCLTSVTKSGSGVGNIYLTRFFKGSTVKYISISPLWIGNSSLISRAFAYAFLKSKILIALNFFKDMVILPISAVLLKRSLVNKGELYITMSSRSIYRLAWFFSLIGHQLKYKIIVWDPPTYITEFTSKSFQWINNADHFFFNKVLENAELVVTMGQRMNEVLGISSRTNVACCKGITKYRQGNLQPLNNDTGFKIIFAGSIYAKDTWNSFIEALIKTGWSISNIPIKLIYVGAPSYHGVNIPDNVICTGKKDHSETMKIISNSHFGYAPYLFDTSFKDASTASFPGKVIDYISSGVPVIYHGPKESELNDVILRSGGGVSINSRDINDTLKTIEKAMKIYSKLRAETEKVHDSEFGFIYEAKN